MELGAGEGARTGVRTEAECAAVADAVAGAGTLRLVGVAGYEGEVPGADPERVRAWLRRLVALAVAFDGGKRFAGAEEIVVSAGGSAWFDAVADVFAEVPELGAGTEVAAVGRVRVARRRALRAADAVQPGAREGALEPAFRLWAQVVSRPTGGAGVHERGQAGRGVRPGSAGGKGGARRDGAERRRRGSR
ncbi:Amino acid deaminase OS=Streptomyces cyaneofuscatus OX=66883 GN=G3I52_23785 PE=3 SV=1 [Streptomyces cyaneofuscatus]